MDNKYIMLRKKMERFNQWEAIEQKKLSESDRFEQFLTLYDLGRLYDEDKLKRIHNNHLMGLVSTNKRLRIAHLKSSSTKSQKCL